MVRIPDVYEVSIKFTSLLPNNFNNFLFNYSQSGDLYEDSGFGESELGHINSWYTKFSDALTKDLETIKNNLQMSKLD